MSELSIKVIIGGRTYPLTIKREEEEKIRKAVTEIENNIKMFRRKKYIRNWNKHEFK